jgi:NAD(P)-dependent dehydrogenase (short-subunit alcohol dehydrogenase family)
MPADLSDWAQAERLIDAVVEAYGVIDGLVNNAALCRMTSMEESDHQMWTQLIGINILGTAACGQRAARYMLEQGSGAIVNVTSGAQYGMEGTSAYGATKGAVASLTYAWAVELGPRGVRVNAISPQADTRMITVLNDFQKSRGVDGNAKAVQQRPSPASNAPAVSFLLSDLASELSGQVVRVSGREIAIVSHPAVLAPSVAASEWTARGIAAAFATQASLTPQPLGVVGVFAKGTVRPGEIGWAIDCQET